MQPATLVLLAAAAVPAHAGEAAEEAARFLEVYDSLYLGLHRAAAEAAWAASTDVTPEHEGARAAADRAWATFVGDPAVVARARSLLERRDELEPLQVRELEFVLLEAGEAPGHLPDLVRRRSELESRAAAVLDSWVFCMVPRAADGSCPEPMSANDIDRLLREERDLDRRLAAWRAAKEIGRPLKPLLAELRDVRNRVAREMGYSSYFGLKAAAYGISADGLVEMLDGWMAEVEPLYGDLRTWAVRELARRYGVDVPEGMPPAHWFPNRWAQEWPGLVEEVDLDRAFAGRTPESIVRDAQALYVSMGFEPLPASFWERSDLYPVPPGEDRRKNAHASAWHVDLERDVRCLMSVEADGEWYRTAHHELGHVYYDLAYARPEVPPLLRRGANRAFHEGIGELMALASSQLPYLRERGVLPRGVRVDRTRAMLDEALVQTVVFLPFSVVVTRFEYELYERDLPPEQWQRRWWELVARYQGIAPSDPSRLDDPELCDACTKTHLVDDPAAYYDYTIATVLKYQLHEHACRDILGRDPRSCSYLGAVEVGDWLRSILEKGATEDWRALLREATGEELSARAMIDYYAPLARWLRRRVR